MHSHSERTADQEIVDVATQFVDQLLLQAQQQVNNKQMAAQSQSQSTAPVTTEPDDDEDITTINGLLKKGTRWHSRARQAGRGLVSRLLTTLRICK